MAAGSRLVRERRSGFTVEVKIARGRRGFGRGSRRAYGTEERSSRERGFALSLLAVVKQRADWNPGLERSLVNILHEFKESGYRGDNGWNSEGWNRMVKEFHVRNKYVSFTKSQIQDKEGQLKRDYKMLKAAKQQSGSTWNERRNMVEGPPALWENLMVVS
ncbi:hypothetical protein Zm00014a_011616 [Zea mays]|uniref:Myb/SANT-like domain-containing protein n=1 Tax=Zea mays TaxID=4577 RepID=A0A3L6FI74_MAIZE|nr:hypothetical protein Zm00014a_011616 [Zea mays]